jgi:hypothetical protein
MPAWKGIIGKGFSSGDFEKYAATVPFGAWRPQFVVLHNTATPKLADWHKVSGAKRMANLETYYRDNHHWSAGPHLFVADDLIWVFTPLNTPGVHSPSWNAIAWGVETVGDYSVEPLGSGVKSNVVNALATLHLLAGLDPQSLRLHKEDPKTTHNCPGKNIVKADVIHWVTDEIDRRHGGAEHAMGVVVGG